jgi:hypothetical protein
MKATDTLLAAWRKANLSIMLKAQIMENHVCDFNEKWGTGDKEELFIEQGHQIGAREIVILTLVDCCVYR